VCGMGYINYLAMHLADTAKRNLRFIKNVNKLSSCHKMSLLIKGACFVLSVLVLQANKSFCHW